MMFYNGGDFTVEFTDGFVDVTSDKNTHINMWMCVN